MKDASARFGYSRFRMPSHNGPEILLSIDIKLCFCLSVYVGHFFFSKDYSQSDTTLWSHLLERRIALSVG